MPQFLHHLEGPMIPHPLSPVAEGRWAEGRCARPWPVAQPLWSLRMGVWTS